MKKNPVSSNKFSCQCRVCNNMIAFDRSKPLPKIWVCPRCGAENYTKPKPGK